MYQYILFDLDGTLTDPKEGITKSVQYALNKEGYGNPPLEDLMTFIGPPLHESFMVYCGVDEQQGKHLVDVYRERFGTIGLFENKVFDGIEELLAMLKKSGRTLAVATSKPTKYTLMIMDKFGLSNYFDAIVGSNMDGTRTVKAEIIEEVFRQLNISEGEKKQCIMVGDRKHDIIGAIACGIDSLGVGFGYSVGDELKENHATYVVETVQELKEFFISDQS